MKNLSVFEALDQFQQVREQLDPGLFVVALLASLLQQKQGKGAQEGREDGGREALEGERSVGTALAQVLVNRGAWLVQAASSLPSLVAPRN